MPTMITMQNVAKVVEKIIQKLLHDAGESVTPTNIHIYSKHIAFVPVMLEPKTVQWTIGIFVKDLAGYHPIDRALCSSKHRMDIDKVCEMMNESIGQGSDETTFIILSTMTFHGNKR